jgi:tetratricopeptide (TPR) repeat protein
MGAATCEPEPPMTLTPDVAPAADAQPKAKIFISYSRKDLAFADRLDAALKARGFEPLIDRSEIYAFEDWWKRIEALIGRADTVVFVLSPNAVASDVALKEVAHGASLNKRFAPIVCRRVEDAAVPEPLRRLNFIFFDDPDRFEASADRLAEALQTDIGWVRQHTDFGEAARRWAAAGRPGGLLLRSPVLEDAERWIASRPRGAPEPTADTQAFVADSRRGATRRRNILTTGLAFGLVIALGLAGLAYWQRGIAVEERQIAEQQRERAEDTLAAATNTANSLVFDLARRFRNSVGVPAALVKDILDKAHALQEQLIKSGQVTPELKRSEAAALTETVDTLLTIGDTAGALAAAEQARQIIADLVAGHPGNMVWQQDLSVSYEKIGDVQARQGDLASALKAYRASLAIRERLAKSDPSNAEWQRDVSVSYERIGDVQMAQGDLAGALTSYRDSLAISERLAKSDPGNAGRQRDLALPYEKVGDVQVAQGDLSGALRSFQASLAILEQLAKSDPDDADGQHDLATVYDRVGNVQEAQDDLAGALKSFRNRLAVMDRLAKSDPGNTEWQRDLSVSYGRIGEIQVARGELAGALESYRTGFAIFDRLAKSDPGNSSWQRDLSVWYNKIGDAQNQQGDLAGALTSYRDSLAISERLAKSDPSNTDWQLDLSVSYDRIGDVLTAQGDLAGSLRSYRDGLTIRERLAKSDPSNVGWQRGLSVSYAKIGDVLAAQGDLVGAMKFYGDRLAITRRLVLLDPTSKQFQRDLNFVIDRIGGMAFKLVLARNFVAALQAADQAIALKPDEIWLYTNRAHALMFAGRTDQARSIYLKYRGTKDVGDGKSWETAILEDFAEFRKAGLTNPLMDEIEKLFTSAG